MIRNTFELLGLTIHFYSITMLAGVVSIWLTSRYIGLKKYPNQGVTIDNIVALLTIVGLIGARIWYVLSNLSKFNNFYEMIAVWNGGIAIQGAIIAGVIGLWIYLSKYTKVITKISAWDVFPIFLIGQAIGRWGNFFNQEVYGQVVSSLVVKNIFKFLLPLYVLLFLIILLSSKPWKLIKTDFKFKNYYLAQMIIAGLLVLFSLIFVSNGWLTELVNHMNINGLFRVPLFLIEATVNIFSYLLIVKIIPKFINFQGMEGSLYFIAYGLLRAVLEPMRNQVDIMQINGVYVSQVLSFVFIIFGITMLILFKKSKQPQWFKKLFNI